MDVAACCCMCFMLLHMCNPVASLLETRMTCLNPDSSYYYSVFAGCNAILKNFAASFLRGGNGQTDWQKMSPFYRTLSHIKVAAQPPPMKTKVKVEQGKVTADHLILLGNFFTFKYYQALKYATTVFKDIFKMIFLSVPSLVRCWENSLLKLSGPCLAW